MIDSYEKKEDEIISYYLCATHWNVLVLLVFYTVTDEAEENKYVHCWFNFSNWPAGQIQTKYLLVPFILHDNRITLVSVVKILEKKILRILHWYFNYHI